MKFLGYIILLIGLWMLVSPQAILGLDALKWMADYAFPFEAILGSIFCAGSFLFINAEQK